MRFIAVTSLFAALAAASSRNNAFNNPAGGYTFTAGETTTVTWDHLTPGTVSLRLQYGSVTTATSGTAIASNIDNTGSFTWKVPTDLVKGREYTIEIIDDSDASDYNFLPYFTVAGATGAASTSAPASTTTSAEETTTTDEATTTTKGSAGHATTTTDASTTTTSSESKTTATTLTKASSTAATTSPSTTATTTDSTSTSESTSASSSASASASASASTTAAPNSNGSVINRVSGGMLALVAGVIAMM